MRTGFTWGAIRNKPWFLDFVFASARVENNTLSIYPVFALIVAHVALGYLQDSKNRFFCRLGNIPKAIRLFLTSCAVLLTVGFGVAAYMTLATQTDTGSGAFMG